MVTVTVNTVQDEIAAVEISGHADYAEHGSDIVWAGFGLCRCQFNRCRYSERIGGTG